MTIENEFYKSVEKAKKYDDLLRMQNNNTGVLYCSFCHKNQDHVVSLIMGPTCFICNECVKLCNEILEEQKKENN